jgi:hypothetical protein
VDQVSHIPYGHHPATCSLNFHPTMTWIMELRLSIQV